jgi:hypothetical protein
MRAARRRRRRRGGAPYVMDGWGDAPRCVRGRGVDGEARI